MRKWLGVAVAAVMACGWAGSAQAYSETIDFSISGFSRFFGDSAFGITPKSTVTGSISLDVTYNEDLRQDVASVTFLQVLAPGYEFSAASFLDSEISKAGLRFDFVRDRDQFYNAFSYIIISSEPGILGYAAFGDEAGSAQCYECVVVNSLSSPSQRVSPVPLPSTALSLGTALFGFGIAGGLGRICRRAVRRA